MNYKAGDIVLTRGNGFLSKAIRFFSRGFGESRTLVNHVGILVEDGETLGETIIVEALTRVKRHTVNTSYGGKNNSIAVFRPITLTDYQLDLIVDKAESYVGNTYGYIKILAHLGDWCLGGVYFFRRIVNMDKYPICLSGNTLIDCPRDLSKFPKGIPIKDLVGQTPFVYAWKDNKLVIRQASKVWCSSKNVSVVRVIVKSHPKANKYWLPPLELIGTPDHLVLLTNGLWRKLKDLKSGDSICSVYRSGSNTNKLYPLRPKLRWTGGDYISEQVFICDQLYGPRPKDHISHHINDKWLDQNPENLQWLHTIDHTSMHHKNKQITLESRLKQSNSQKKRFQYNDHPMLGKQHNEQSCINMAEGQKRRYNRPEERIKSSLAAKKRYINRNDNHTVVLVEPYGEMDVFDMTVPDADSFIANGMVVHNCSWLVAYAYTAAGKNFGVDAGAATPDDIWDFCINNSDKYTCIRELSKYE